MKHFAVLFAALVAATSAQSADNPSEMTRAEQIAAYRANLTRQTASNARLSDAAKKVKREAPAATEPSDAALAAFVASMQAEYDRRKAEEAEAAKTAWLARHPRLTETDYAEFLKLTPRQRHVWEYNYSHK